MILFSLLNGYLQSSFCDKIQDEIMRLNHVLNRVQTLWRDSAEVSGAPGVRVF